MSWSFNVTGKREAVRAYVEGLKPTQKQMALARDLVLDELGREPETWSGTGVRIDASGHSSPQGEGWEKAAPSSHKSGSMRVIIECITLVE